MPAHRDVEHLRAKAPKPRVTRKSRILRGLRRAASNGRSCMGRLSALRPEPKAGVLSGAPDETCGAAGGFARRQHAHRGLCRKYRPKTLRIAMAGPGFETQEGRAAYAATTRRYGGSFQAPCAGSGAVGGRRIRAPNCWRRGSTKPPRTVPASARVRGLAAESARRRVENNPPGAMTGTSARSGGRSARHAARARPAKARRSPDAGRRRRARMLMPSFMT